MVKKIERSIILHFLIFSGRFCAYQSLLLLSVPRNQKHLSQSTEQIYQNAKIQKSFHFHNDF